MRRFEENRKTYPVFSPLRGFLLFILNMVFHICQTYPRSKPAGRR
ncbi:hypothetical protein SELSPUOL_01507 [Selenomonas sputigena ATCC 35185]|uniref:Uncharacterized protein n=1 Tax=Selenomonas sputigena (strain ATCC 35185 / DSM 20758 / CCUG 44933 / VPI D19B-28) TaxID=546271 RepID=C9LVL3_SELS3|nr:hypothetical protein SELSPUOL_01507 [Selenomonas sputigena ATCC 35185]